MFGGMMNPEMMRLAQEQMSRMKPEDLQRMQQQMMSNPDLLRMASEGMKNMRPEDLRMAAERMKDIPADQIADMSSRMANASPEEIASMRAQGDSQRSYEYQGALSLKTQGNQLHNVGKYSEAAEKYLRAKNNLAGQLTGEAKNLQLTCSLNLMSCYLKTKQYKEVIAEGSEVLEGDSGNLKALYRRGQAYKELKQYKLSVPDLKKAADISPDDETIAQMLRQAREELDAECGEEEEEEKDSKEGLISNGPIIEEISDEEAEKLSSRLRDSTAESSSNGSSVVTDDGGQSSAREGTPPMQNGSMMGDNLKSFAQNPEMMRSMQEMMSNMDPDHVAAMTGGNMTPEMAKMAADMMKGMSPDALEQMMGMASQFQNPGGATPFQAPPPRPDPIRPVRQSSAPVATSSATTMNRSTARSRSESQSSTSNISPSLRQNSGEGMPSMANFSPEMQEQLRKQMSDPGMKQMMASMVKNLTPEAMTSMGESMGLKLSPEDAAQAQKMFANLNPDDIDRLMVWADRAQRVVAQAKQVKTWVLGRAGLILALAMLVFAVILHRLGYIG